MMHCLFSHFNRKEGVAKPLCGADLMDVLGSVHAHL